MRTHARVRVATLGGLGLVCFVWLAGLGIGCTCSPTGVKGTTFGCSADADCASGYHCASGTCILNGTDAGPGGGAGGGGSATGGGIGAEGSLKFAGNPVTVLQGSCSVPITYALVDIDGAPLTPTTPITVNIAGPGASFFATASDCPATPVSTLTLSAASGTFTMLANQSGSITVTLSAGGFNSASQVEMVAGGGTPVALNVSGPGRLKAGECGAFAVGLVDANDAGASMTSDLMVTLASTPAPFTYFSDAQCHTAVNQLTLPANAMNAPIFGGSRTGVDYQLTASSPVVDPGSLDVSVTPVVRTVVCSYGATDTTTTCALNPPLRNLNDSFVMYQALPVSNSTGQTESRCRLDGVNAVTCSRSTSGSALNVRVQVAEADGLQVQQYTQVCDAGVDAGNYGLDVPLTTAVDPNGTMVLVAQENPGNIIDGNDFVVVQLDGGTALSFDFGICSTGTTPTIVTAQVISMPSPVQVSHLQAFLNVDAGSTFVPSAGDGGFVLYQPRTRTLGYGTCDRAVRASVGPTSIGFFRGNGAVDGCYDISLSIFGQQILPGALAQVQQVTFNMPEGTGAVKATLGTAVDPTRTLVFSGGQGAFGQAWGEGDWAAPEFDSALAGETAAQFVLDGGSLTTTQLGAQRVSTDGGAKFGAFVVEINP